MSRWKSRSSKGRASAGLGFITSRWDRDAEAERLAAADAFLKAKEPLPPARPGWLEPEEEDKP